MKKPVSFILSGLLAVGSSVCFADDTAASPHSFTANVAISTDYLFRGITQTTGDPSVSGGMDYTYTGEPVSAFAGVWASNIDFNEGGLGVSNVATLETDFYGGLNGSLAVGDGLGWKLGGIYYAYPGSNPKPALTVNYDYFEFYGTLNYDFKSFNVTGGFNYSPDYFAESGEAVYIFGEVGVPLPSDFVLSGHVGHQSIEKNGAFGTPDYVDWNVGLAKTFGHFTFKVAYVDTDLSKAQCFGGTGFCSSTAMFTVSSSF